MATDQLKVLDRNVDTIGFITPAMFTAASTNDQLVAKVVGELSSLVRRIAEGKASPCPMPLRSHTKANHDVLEPSGNSSVVMPHMIIPTGQSKVEGT